FTTTHHYDDFEIKESDWADIESQSGYKLEQSSRSAILKAKFCTLRLSNILKDFVAACNAATQELKMLEGKGKLPKGFKRSEPFKDGDAWNECVATIANVLTKEGLRVSTTPNKSGQSNFVRLIEALHKRFPPNLLPKRSGDDALEKAIQRAIHQKTLRT